MILISPHHDAPAQKRALFYRAIRAKWIIFNRWLKFIEKETLNSTYGLSSMLRRREYLFRGLHRNLVDLGFLPVVYYNSRRLMMQSCLLSVTFHRLQVNAQEAIVFRMLEQKADSLFKVKLLMRCFLLMKTLRSGWFGFFHLTLNLSLLTQPPPPCDLHTPVPEVCEIHRASPPYLEVRHRSDIDQMVKRFTSRRKRSTPYIIKKVSAQFTKRQVFT